MATKRDYYEVLGLGRTASPKKVADAYRRMAIQYHPDSNPDDEVAVERFKEAAEAYEVLGDAQKRARYDQFGHAGVNGPGGATHFSDVSEIFEAFSDVFGSSLFGDLFGGQRRGRRVRRGADIKCEVALDLEEAARDVTKPIQFERHQQCRNCSGSGSAPGSSPQPCVRCGGQGQVVQQAGILHVQTTCPTCRGAGSRITDPCTTCQGTRHETKNVRLDVAIPAGIEDGMRVRLSGEGEPSPGGGPPGDCYCFVSIREHSLFHRDGNNLILQLPITYPQAVLGASVEVPTLDGGDHLTIPAGTQSGEVFRIRRRGMPDTRGRGMGDLLIQVFVEVPKHVNSLQEETLRKLAELEQANVTPQRKSFLEKAADLFRSDESC